MNSIPNPYPSYHAIFGEQREVTDDGAYQHTTISGLVPSQLEPDQNWVSQQLEDLMAVKAHIDVKLRELQDLYHKQQDTLARLRALNTTTTTSTWNIPPQPTSSSAVSYAQAVTYPPLQAEYTAHNRAGQKGGVARYCETSERARKRHICHCGKGYARKDSLLRHAAIHASPESRFV